MIPDKSMVGVVIRADGTVPFDDDCPDHVRSHILAHLTDVGHTFSKVEDTKHVRLHNWQASG